MARYGGLRRVRGEICVRGDAERVLVQRDKTGRNEARGIESAVQAVSVQEVPGADCGGNLMRKLQRSIKTRFVICVDNRGYEASLEPGKVYRVLTDREASTIHFLRVIDESGEDYLFPSRMFRRNSSSRREMPGPSTALGTS